MSGLGEKYTRYTLPWRRHPYDEAGQILVMRSEGGRYISIAQTRDTGDYKYSVVTVHPDAHTLSEARQDQTQKMLLTAEEFDKWVSGFTPGTLTFGPAVYRKNPQGQVA